MKLHRLVPFCCRAAIVFASVLVPMVACPCPRADAFDPLGFQIEVPQGGLVVNEDARRAVITVTRDSLESAFAAQIRYITLGDGYDPATNAPFQCGSSPCTATSYDFTSVKGVLDFASGQTSITFSIPIVDQHQYSVPKTLRVALFGPSPAPIGLGRRSATYLTILDNDPADPPPAGNPLGLPISPRGADPLAGAEFFVDHEGMFASEARRYRALRAIAAQPGTQHFGNFSTNSPYVPDIGTAVSRYLTRAAAEEPGTIPMLSTYRIVYGHCGHWSDPPAEQQAYHNFIEGFAHGIGSYPAVLFLEEDSLITSPCLTRHGLTVRMNELNDAIDVLTANCPHLVIYVDAGAADALRPRDAARLLERAGVAKIQGFFLNATHFDWTSKEIRYGEQISRMTGGKHFVVNTAENGRGPLATRDRVHQGNEVLCNPPGRGLGPRPTANTGYRNVDAFAWIANPGVSGGQCRPGAPPGGDLWAQYATQMVQDADYRVR